MELIVPIVVFLGIFGVALVVTRQSSGAVSRLGRHEIAAPMGPNVAVRTPRHSILGGSRQSGLVGQIAGRVAQPKARTNAGKLLLEADSSMPLGTFLLIRAVLTFAVMPMYLFYIYQSYGLSLVGVVALLVGGLAIPFIPTFLCKRKARKRARAIELAMPDALDLLVVSVEGGLSMDGGLQQVARRSKGVLATEFGRLLGEISTGMSRRDAFQALGARSQSESLRIFCATIVQADKMGMSIGSTLRTLTDTMRTKRRQAAETQARKAPIKMLPFLVIFMMPSLFIVILGPAILDIMKFFDSLSA